MPDDLLLTVVWLIIFAALAGIVLLQFWWREHRAEMTPEERKAEDIKSREELSYW